MSESKPRSSYPNPISKREALLLVGTSFLFRPIAAFSQSPESYSEITPLFELANKVRAAAIGIPLSEFRPEMMKLLRYDIESRVYTLSVARDTGVFSTNATANSYVNGLAQVLPNGSATKIDDLYISSIREVVATISENNLPLVPEPDSVVPIRIALVPPVVDANPDTDLIIIVDIFLDTLGISLGGESLAKAIIQSDDELARTLQRLLAAVTTKDWEAVASLAETAFKLFVGSKVWSEIKERGSKKMAFRFGLRAVPILGWVYLAIAFLVSVKQNYNRFSFA